MSTLNKSQIWERVEAIFAEYEIGEEAQKDLAELLKPKGKGSSSNRIIKTIDDTEYRNCRFTGRLWKLEDLVYQNDEKRSESKDKGYSNVGISLWNKGQKKIKDIKNDLTDEIMKDEPDLDKVTSLKGELKEIESGNLGNDFNWLLQFATKEQEKSIKNDSYDINIEE